MSEKIKDNLDWWMKNRGIPFLPEVIFAWGKDLPMSEETVAMLANLMTNVGRPVYAFAGNVPAEVTTSLFARYSRSPRPLRSLLVREFWGEHGIDLGKARVLANRVTQEFGDESVKQLGNICIACEMVSQLAVKEIEDTRIGGFLEKSSRYVDFGKQVSGKNMYLRPLELGQSLGEYERVMDEAFDLYRLAVEKLVPLIETRFPKKDNTDEKVYKASIRAKVFDIARVFLPMATLTNAGIVVSAQTVEHMTNKMKASRLIESRMLGTDIQNEANLVVPALIKSTDNDKHGKEFVEYLHKAYEETERVVEDLLGLDKIEVENKGEQKVKLVWKDDKALEKIAAGILYPMTSKDLSELDDLISGMNEVEKKDLVEAYLAGRTDRRHKPGRAFELAYYTFEIQCKVAEWRDLQRHRMLTPQRQLMTMDYGYNTPREFFEVRVEDKLLAQMYADHMGKRKRLYNEIRENISPEVGQYVVGFGNYMKWMINANLRELYHMIPLRAGEAGHSDYRRIAREVFYLLVDSDPILAMPMERFIDFSDEPKLERLQQLEKVKKRLENIGTDESDTFSEL